MILPKITSIVVGENGHYFARAPSPGWQNVLEEWHTFVDDDVRWPAFADYISPITGWLYDCYSGNNFLNKQFERHFDGFEASEVQSFPSLLERLVTARSGIRQIQFEGAEIELLMKLSAAVGDLKVRRHGLSYKVRDLIAGRGQPPETADLPLV